MFALNFISPHNEKLLTARQKSATIRPGDIRDVYPENSIVWITVGSRYGSKRKLYTAVIDRTIVKKFSDLTTKELTHQNPEIKNVNELIKEFEEIYEKKLDIEDYVTVIHFSEIIGAEG
ncbi:Hypothetical protein LUCI_4275 [Lucifera butyrica]|uniref:ASCH domain-containing protein n=1 Tax=Lucifera butyrica TaxID=1351585 RepID=A0A498RCL0_9FIRM|nr:ASCH domain-containing protein [Lucifera butyrica]VBB08989.1 Hypothetical protein LUCI_4275 [Lucifera butyrica]